MDNKFDSYHMPEEDDITLIDKEEDDITLIDREDDTTLVDREEDITLIDKKGKIPTSGGTVWARGDIINNLYRVENIVKGGMGIIYFIEHLKWGIKLVVKSPLERFLVAEHKTLFIKEAETWVDLGKHPNIITAFYVRELHGIPRIFIEFAGGGSLTDWLKEGKLKDLSSVLDIAIQFCEGIIYAHSRGLVHRDIKPDNVLMLEDGTAKITDFGLVKTRDEKMSDDALEKLKRPSTIDPQEWKTFITGGVMGSPPYIAPEQWKKASKADKRSDIYSFGVMLYEMICKRRPFIKERDNPYPVKVAYQLMHTLNPPPDPAEFYPHIPAKLKSLLLRCLEKEPEKRYKNFEEIQKELTDIYREVTGKTFKKSKIGEGELKAGDLNNRALSYIDLGKKVEAAKLLEEAIKLDPNFLPANINLILLLAEENWDVYENILLRFKAIRDGNPSSYIPYYYEAIYEFEWGNPSSALHLITRALELNSSNHLLWNFKGMILGKLSKYAEALEAFKEAIKLDNTKIEYIRNCGIALYYMGKYEESSQEFQKLLEFFPEDNEFKIDMAISLAGTGDIDTATALFAEILERNPQEIRANLYLGELLTGIDIFVPSFCRLPYDKDIEDGGYFLK